MSCVTPQYTSRAVVYIFMSRMHFEAWLSPKFNDSSFLTSRVEIEQCPTNLTSTEWVEQWDRNSTRHCWQLFELKSKHTHRYVRRGARSQPCPCPWGTHLGGTHWCGDRHSTLRLCFRAIRPNSLRRGAKHVLHFIRAALDAHQRAGG